MTDTSHFVLYRKYRPQLFDEVLGQEHVTSVLKNAIEKYNKSMPVVASFYDNRIYLSDVLASISNLETAKGLIFSSVSIDTQPSVKTVKVNITGTGDNREDLISFQKELEGQRQIKNVSFSADSWINPTNTNFKLSFEFQENGN